VPSAPAIDFSTWPFLNQFSAEYHLGYGRKEAVVKPDGFIHLRADKPNGLEHHAFFLELDRSTESLSILADKALHYRAYYRSGGFAERSGDHPDAYRNHPFRVLMVCKSEARRDNAARRLLSIDPPIKTMVWLTTMPEVLNNPLEPIWSRPVDYQETLINSNRRTSGSYQIDKYRRQIALGKKVEATRKKHKLLY
jgi:hypothetical protein